MVLIGVLARIVPERRAALWADLEARVGVQPFNLEDGQVEGGDLAADGVRDEARSVILLEAESLAAAHERLTQEINGVDGIQGTWPVYSDVDDDEETGAEQAVRAALQGGEAK